MKDKKFKAVNREENYAKPDAPDMQLGRHSRRICSANGGLPPLVKRQRYYMALAAA